MTITPLGQIDTLEQLEATVADAAACVGADPALFTDPEQLHRTTAERYCSTCPVQLECYVLALELDAPVGIWGGVRFGATGPATEPRLSR